MEDDDHHLTLLEYKAYHHDEAFQSHARKENSAYYRYERFSERMNDNNFPSSLSHHTGGAP